MPASLPFTLYNLPRLLVLLVCCGLAGGCSRVLDIVDSDPLDLATEQINACAPYLEAVEQSAQFFDRPIYALTLTSGRVGEVEATATDGARLAARQGGTEASPKGYLAYLQSQYDDDSTRIFYLFSDLQLDIQQAEQARLRLVQALSCLKQESEILQRKQDAALVGAEDARKQLTEFLAERMQTLDMADRIARDMAARHERFVYAHNGLQPSQEGFYRQLRRDVEVSTEPRSELEAARQRETEIGRRTTVALADYWLSMREFTDALANGAPSRQATNLVALPF